MKIKSIGIFKKKERMKFLTILILYVFKHYLFTYRQI